MSENRIYFNVSDLRELKYCERIVWFRYVLGVSGVPTPQMEAGVGAHIDFENLEKRRRFRKYGLQIARRKFNVFVKSKELGLSGAIDMLLILEGEGRAAVVEVKRTRFPDILKHIVVQVGAYALLVEECLGYDVDVGFVYLVLQNGVKDIIIDEKVRGGVVRSVERLKEIVEMSEPPKAPIYKSQCGGCEYRRFCDDIW